MKKLWLVLLLLCPLKVFAAIIDEGVTREKTYVIHFTTTVPANTTSVFDLISLSTTASLFPHTLNNLNDIGEIDVSHITTLFDKVATATTTAKMGVITAINPSTGSASYFFTRSSLNNVSNTDVVVTANFTPAFYRCKVKPVAGADGTTPFLLTNDKDQGSGIFNSTAAFNSSNGTMSLRVGDIVMKIVTFASAVNYIIDVWYHAEP